SGLAMRRPDRQRRHLDRRILGADFDRARFDIEGRGLAALGDHPIMSGADRRRAGAADLVDVEETGPQSDEDSEYRDNQNQQYGAHLSSSVSLSRELSGCLLTQRRLIEEGC